MVPGKETAFAKVPQIFHCSLLPLRMVGIPSLGAGGLRVSLPPHCGMHMFGVWTAQNLSHTS